VLYLIFILSYWAVMHLLIDFQNLISIIYTNLKKSSYMKVIIYIFYCFSCESFLPKYIPQCYHVNVFLDNGKANYYRWLFQKKKNPQSSKANASINASLLIFDIPIFQNSSTKSWEVDINKIDISSLEYARWSIPTYSFKVLEIWTS
jgi:hypothetical protein